MAKAKHLLGKDSYDWKFTTVGGVTRVSIESGADIAQLPSLDPKLWTVLSCPVKGLEFDERTLTLMDTDHDGKIRLNEVTGASLWLQKVLVDMDYLLKGNDSIDFASVKSDTEEGKQVLEAAHTILSKLASDKQSIALSDVADYMAVYEEKCKADYSAAETDPFEPPYGDNSDAAEAAVNAIRGKVDDWFLRCRLAQFDSDALQALDVQVEKIATISGSNLTDNLDEIGSYPLARPTQDALLPLTSGINPAWQAKMEEFKRTVLDTECPGADSFDEKLWNAVTAKIDAYTAWKLAGETAMNEAIAEQLATHAAALEPVERLLHYCRDYFKLLHNYVVMKDFYRRDNQALAIFQAGKLFIDQRQCDLCIRVADMPKQLASASLSGLYLVYCHCTAKSGGAQMDIVAALTDGDTDGLREGKNAVFYDRDGQDYDAVVTKIIDNPISVRQAFWSPYRKFSNWVTDKITKSASEKESKQFDEMTSKADSASTSLTAKTDAAAPDAKAAEKKAQMFDIAKFAGIFAAIGLAIGAIGGALAALGKFVTLHWYNVILLVAAIVILISGPSMLLAWLKLRKRNLGPVLNANGWAINSKIKINTAFGATLTSIAKYPKVAGKDPFADKKMAWWKKCLIWIAVLALLFLGIFYLTQHRLPWQPKPEPAALVEEATEGQPADTVAVADSTAADAPAEQ